MDLPDPAELWGYYRRLHDAGFGDETARAILAAVVTGEAHTGVAPTGVGLAPAPGPIAHSGEAKLDPGAQPRCNPKARDLPPGSRPVLLSLAVLLVAFALAVPRILPW